MGSQPETKTNTVVSQPTNPAVQDTATKIAGGIDKAFDAGPQVFDKSTYAGVGANTKNSWEQAIGAAGNTDFASGVGGALKSYGDTAAGKNIGMLDPGYAAIRSKLQNDVMAGTNASFDGSGLFGSDSNRKAAASGLTDSLGALDYKQYSDSLDRQTQAAGMLPSLFNANQLPASITGAVGSAQDADKQAGLMGEYDLHQRKANAWTDLLAKLTSTAAGNATGVGTTVNSTSTEPGVPLWQQILGGGLGIAGALL